jgi:hypothetical protein
VLPLSLRLGVAAGLGLLVQACAVDSGPAPSFDGAPPSDAAPVPDGAPSPVDATPACIDAELAVAETGHHQPRYDRTDNGGAGCMGGSCHNGIGLGETYTAAGSLWNRRTAGGDPIEGAYIYIIDGNGKVVELMTAQNGFFWTDEELMAPIRTYASGCPSVLGMEDDTTGNCNSAACHSEDNKIYLPLVQPGI